LADLAVCGAAILGLYRITAGFIALAAGMRRFIIAAQASANARIDLAGDSKYEQE